uniref:Uncharacterized protein n=1 Tax=Babesia bovis TaxID=5865 RepID=S6B821_BABBO|nr:hypothetical protein [Babesia bovis]
MVMPSKDFNIRAFTIVGVILAYINYVTERCVLRLCAGIPVRTKEVCCTGVSSLQTKKITY